MPKSREFKYQKRGQDDVKKRAEQSSGNYDSFVREDIKVFKPRAGKNIIRILPPTWKDPKHFGFDVWVNYNVGPDGQTYLSLSKMLNKDDPLEDAKKIAEKDGDKELGDALTPKRRVGVYLIDRNEEEAGVQFWAMPWTVDKDIANICFDEDTHDVFFPDDPNKGHDLRFYREGEGLKTEYPGAKMKLLKSSYLHEDEDTQNEWLDFITDNPIPEMLVYFDYDHINSVFNGQMKSSDKGSRRARDDDDDDRGGRQSSRRSRDDDDKPSRRSRGEDEDDRPSRRSSRDDDDDDKDERPTRRRSRDDDDDNKDERPTRRGARDDGDDERPSRRRPRDEEDDDKDERPSRRRSRLSDDDGDDDKDERPKRRRGGTEDDDDDDDKDDKPGRRSKDDDGDADDKPSRRSSVRERIRGRNRDED